MAEPPHPATRSRVMLVTGASSGIGEATARRLAREPGSSLVLVARREERLRALAAELGEQRTSVVAVDLLDEDAPAQIRDHVVERHDRLDLLVNNAGAAWRARFADGGYENVRRTMAINFDAQLRLTEALLGLLRSSAPSAIVNVASTAGRVARAGSGAYSASKFALAGWSDSLWAEERPPWDTRGPGAPGLHRHRGLPPVRAHREALDALDRLDPRSRCRGDLRGGHRSDRIHVGLVLPGFIATEGFPQSELTEKPWTRWIVSTPAAAAEAIYEAGIGRRPERYVPPPS